MGGVRQIKNCREGSKEDTFMRNQHNAECAKWGYKGGVGVMTWPESRYMRRLRKRELVREAKKLNRKNK